jgi:hypothetical protein
VEQLLVLGSARQRITVALGERFEGDLPLGNGDWSHAQIGVEAGPFKGTVETVVETSAYRVAAEAFMSTGNAHFGGHRDVLLRLERDGSTVHVEVILTEDDPQVTLRYLIFE